MSYAVITPIKEAEWFKAKKAAVFRGEIEPDGFDTEDYKYFDKMRELGIRYRAGEISKEQFAEIDKQYYAEYEQFKESYLEHIANAAMVFNNIKRSEALRVEIIKATDSKTKLDLALKCISAMLCDADAFYNAAKGGLNNG